MNVQLLLVMSGAVKILNMPGETRATRLNTVTMVSQHTLLLTTHTHTHTTYTHKHTHTLTLTSHIYVYTHTHTHTHTH